MDENPLGKAKVALAIIDHLARQEWSPEQESMLRAAHYILSWQCSPLGVGIEPLREGTVGIILHAAENFKWRLDKRYPQWQSLEESQMDMSLPPLSEEHEESFMKEAMQEIEPFPDQSIISQDCQCTDHMGPHWLYEDYYEYQCNLMRLEQCAEHIQNLASLSLPPEEKSGHLHVGWLQLQRARIDYHNFLLEERARWHKKLCHMQEGKINSISYKVLGPDFEDLSTRKRALITRIKDHLLKICAEEAGHDGQVIAREA